MRPLVPLALAWLLGLWVPGAHVAWLGAAAVLGGLAWRLRSVLLAWACAFAAAHGLTAAPVVLPSGEGPHEGVVVRPTQLDMTAGVRRVLVEVDGLRVQVSDDDVSAPVPLPGDRVRFRGEPSLFDGVELSAELDEQMIGQTPERSVTVLADLNMAVVAMEIVVLVRHDYQPRNPRRQERLEAIL